MPEVKTVKILIVDDHPIFIKGLASLIESRREYKVIAEASSLADALTLAGKEKPDLAIVEINLGNESSMDLIPRLKSQSPDMAILVLSMHDERYYSERVLRLGARGYIMKTEQPNKVLDAIKTITSGKVYLSDTERERILEAMTGESQRGGKDWTVSVRKLSDRELQIFSCIGKGLGTIEIANKYNISTKTIDTHKEHLKLKLHCNSSQELRRLAIEWSSHPGNPNVPVL
jgi:DNA-binding NarL/FixJ family response regulator